MANDYAAYSSAFETLSIIDYAGSPVTLALTAYVVGSFQGPVVDAHAHTVLYQNSSSGKARAGAPEHGLAGGQTGSFQMWTQDVKNNTDKNWLSLCRALQINSVAATGHSGETYTSQLTLGGKLQAKLSRAQKNQVGTTSTSTYPAIITGIEEGVGEEAKMMTINFELVGSITYA